MASYFDIGGSISFFFPRSSIVRQRREIICKVARSDFRVSGQRFAPGREGHRAIGARLIALPLPCRASRPLLGADQGEPLWFCSRSARDKSWLLQRAVLCIGANGSHGNCANQSVLDGNRRAPVEVIDVEVKSG